MIGNLHILFSSPQATVRFYFTPGMGRIILNGTAQGRLSNGGCGLYEFEIELTSGFQSLYGEPAALVAFLVTEKSATAPHQRIPVFFSHNNTGIIYPYGQPHNNITIALADMTTDSVFSTMPDISELVDDYSPVQFMIAVSLPTAPYVGTYTGAGAIRANCSSAIPWTATRAAVCAGSVNELITGLFMFDIESLCNECCLPTPTPGLCPIHGVSHSHSQSMSQSQSLTPIPSGSPVPFRLGYSPYNVSCYNTYPGIITECGLLNSAVFAPEIWEDTSITYHEFPYPNNSPFAGFSMYRVEFNATLIRSSRRYVKFSVPNMPGRTMIYLTVYLWSNVSRNPPDYDYNGQQFPFPNSMWEPSELNLYEMQRQTTVFVGAGDGPRTVCDRAGNIARCEVPFPQYGGYLYIGVGTLPSVPLTYDIGFVYIDMLMVNEIGFDNTYAEGQPIIGVPNCVMLNLSIGTPHDPICNQAWDSAAPTLGSDAYSFALSTTTAGLFVMGGVGAASFVFFKMPTMGSTLLSRKRKVGLTKVGTPAPVLEQEVIDVDDVLAERF